MKIHEYQGKEIFKKYQINIPKGIPAFSIEEAKNAFDKRILLDMDSKNKSRLMRAIASKLRDYKDEGALIFGFIVPS